jgi:hypothetical protein
VTDEEVQLPETNLLMGRRWMLFVDGENFTIRGQKVMSEANIPLEPEGGWLKDIYLWLPGWGATTPLLSRWPRIHYARVSTPPPGEPSPLSAVRAYYYTSMPFENERAVTDAKLALRAMRFEPKVFRRLASDKDRPVDERSKAVDLSLATDVLTLAGEDRFDTAVIFSGDGDFVPVVEALKRLGRQVVVGGFVSTTNDDLRIAADDFIDLTGYLTNAWRERYASRARMAERETRRKARDESVVASSELIRPPRSTESG